MPTLYHTQDTCYSINMLDSLDDEINDLLLTVFPTLWSRDAAIAVEATYRRVEHRLMATHSREDDRGLAIRLSAFAASCGY
jgi:hypothetical protein